MVVNTDPERKKTLAQLRLKINGSPASKEIDGAIISVTVEQDVDMPAMFTIVLHFDARQTKMIDEPTIADGKEIEILVGYADQEKSICIGKITAMEPRFDDQGTTHVIRGFDYSFAMHRNAKSRSFVKQTDSDIAKKIAAEASGLTAKVEATTQVHDYVYQHNQTNWAFLSTRARRIGYILRVVGKELQFKKPEPEGTPVDLEFGVNLKSFNARLSVAEQVNEVEVRGWDVKNKQAIVGRASSSTAKPDVGEKRKASEVAAGVWGEATRYELNGSPDGVDEANLRATAILDDTTKSFITAEGECNGDPKFALGGTINVKGVGERFQGKYYLTSVQHNLSKTGGHQVKFRAGRTRSESMSSILSPPPDQAVAPQVTVGVVTNNRDDDGLARVKVKFPMLFDDDESHWARQAVPMAGADRGFIAMPEVNDEVLVAFEHGDPTKPFILGSLWNGVDQPPKGTADLVDGGGVVNQRIWRSRSGHLFLFDDTDGSEAIRIIDKTNKNHITITSSDNKLQVQIEGDIEVTSQTGKISMTAEKDINIESKSGKISLKAVNAEVEAKQSAKMKTGTSFDVDAGTSFAAKATTSAELNGSVSAKLEGGIANVQGQSATNIKGGIVNIN